MTGITKLNEILDIKAEIKTALISAGITETTDVLETYPALIRTLLLSGDDDMFRDMFFELVPDEYIERYEEIDGKYYKISCEKWKYKYGYNYVAGAEISREEVEEILNSVLYVETTDGSEISISYTDSDGAQQTMQTIGGKLPNLLVPVEGSNVKLTNWDKIQIVHSLNTDYLPGNVKDYIFVNHKNIEKVEEFICRNAESLSTFFQNCEKIDTVNIYASDNLTDISYVCQRSSGAPVKYLHIYDAYNIQNMRNMCHADYTSYHGEEVTLSFNAVTSLNDTFCRYAFKTLNIIGGPFSNNVTTYNSFCYSDYAGGTQKNLTKITGLDVSKITDWTKFQFFSDDANLTNVTKCRFEVLTDCKIDGLGVGCQIINSHFYPANNVWNEEDAVYSFSNIAQTDNPNAIIYCSNRLKSIFLNNKDLIATVVERGYSLFWDGEVQYAPDRKIRVALTYNANKTNKIVKCSYMLKNGTWGDYAQTDENGVIYADSERDSNPDYQNLGFGGSADKANVTEVYFDFTGTEFCYPNCDSMTQLEKITIKADKLIGANFGYSSNITTIVFPDDLTRFMTDTTTFRNCSKLTNLVNLSTMPAQYISIVSDSLSHQSITDLVEALSPANNYTINVSKTTYNYMLESGLIDKATDKGYTVTA